MSSPRRSPFAPIIDQHTNRRTALRAVGLGAVLAGTGGLLAGCGDDSSSSGASGGSGGGSTEFKIASAPGDNYFLDHVCKEQGTFTANKLDVGDFVFPQSGVQAMQLFAAGAITGMQQDTLLTMTSYANAQQGSRPQIVGMRIPETTYAIVVGKGSWPDPSASYEERMQALKGKKVGVAAVGAGSDQTLRLALEEAGMGYDDVTHLGVGQFAPAIQQMQQGRIDAYVAVTYATSFMMANVTGGSVLVPFWEDNTPDLMHKQEVQPIIVREDYLADNAAVVESWKTAAWEGKDWIVANQDAAAKMLNESQFNGTAEAESKSYIDHYVTVTVPKLEDNWKVKKEGIDNMIVVAEKLGMITSGQLTYEDIVAESARA